MFYPTVDLQVTNTPPYGIVIWPTYNDTSVTVQLWSHSVGGARKRQDEPPAADRSRRPHGDDLPKQDPGFGLSSGELPLRLTRGLQ